mmetsp:Transcript_5377/g.20174  ORF Transcript_5377/g.20174 Transcript_5377/m.20174 type:complete len:243 (-) Transcript_5377:968-1696(-)
MYRESSAVAVSAILVLPTTRSFTSKSIPPSAFVSPATVDVTPAVVFPDHPSRRVEVMDNEVLGSLGAATIVTPITLYSTSVACSPVVAASPAAGATNTGVKACVVRDTDTTSAPMCLPVTILETLVTSRNASSTSVSGYARVISTRYSAFVVASCAVTSTTTALLPTRSETCREYGASRLRATARPASPPTSTPCINTAFTRTACARISSGCANTLMEVTSCGTETVYVYTSGENAGEGTAE